MAKGLVYILTNPCLDGWVKIGMTERNDIERRLRNIENFKKITTLKVAANYRPGRREMGFASRLGGAMSSGFSHKQLMLAERPSL